MEANAVMTIVSLCERGEWVLLSSDIIDYELSQTPDGDKLRQIEDFYSVAGEHLSLSPETEKRARYFQRFGIKLYDSYHLAIAETGNADIILTVDNRFLRNADKINDLRVRLDNPVYWLMEVMRNE
jgi:predicted nucleic acid-binding protein